MADKEKSEKVGFGTRVKNGFRALTGELKKIVWPTFKQVRNNTGVVIVAIVVVGIFVAILDLIFSQGRNLFLPF